ncbi:MAG: hypothetical protein JKY71_01890 [Alphaproteobacteria bacterium]|nr:hypothetical protein [Alphaproteobacteria bacterium]
MLYGVTSNVPKGEEEYIVELQSDFVLPINRSSDLPGNMITFALNLIAISIYSHEKRRLYCTIKDKDPSFTHYKHWKSVKQNLKILEDNGYIKMTKIDDNIRVDIGPFPKK